MVKQKAVTTNTQLLQYVQSLSDHAVVRGEETNAKDYTRSFKVGSSHMTVSSQVMSFESSRLAVDFGVILASSGVTFLDRSDSQV